MRRLLHSLGRWRATHCDKCGRRITPGQSAIAGPGNYRMVHYNPDHCGDTAARRPRDRHRAARIAVAATAILTLAAIAVLLIDHNRHHARPELLTLAASSAAFAAAQILERRAHIRRLTDHDPTLRETTSKDSER